MDSPFHDPRWFDERIHPQFSDNFIPYYKDLEEVAVALLNGYTKFARHGIPSETISHVMMEATINFHRLFVTPSELPALLRGLADKIEREHTIWQN